MRYYSRGNYLVKNKSQADFDGILLSETIYSAGFTSNWHFHENPYFTFILNGGSIEERKKLSNECVPGQLLFYYWQIPHRNSNYQPSSRNFNIEFDKHWLNELGVTVTGINDVFLLDDINSKLMLLKIFKEYRQIDICSEIAIQSTGLKLLSSISKKEKEEKYLPGWVKPLAELLNDCCDKNYSLRELSALLHIHPITISKNFPKFFNCTLGEYMRRTKICRSLSLVKKPDLSLTDVAYSCGFADQSHFTRVFKQMTGFLPGQYKRF